MIKISYPYLPEGRNFKYVSLDNQFMRVAKNYAMSNSLDYNTPTGSVVVRDSMIIGLGANGTLYHKNNPCIRVIKKIPTGQGYDMCEGCDPKNHSEPKAIADAINKKHDPIGADLYLWGHWWCCRWCWDSIIRAGIKDVYLLEDSWKLFDDESEHNILGKQFELFASELRSRT